MRVYCFHKTITSPSMKSFHYTMFHGAYLDRNRRLAPWSELDTDPTKEIELIRNGTCFPDIFQPVIRPIISERLMGSVTGLCKRLQFFPVRLSKLIYFPFAFGDMSYYSSGEYRNWPSDTTELLFRLPDESGLHRNAPRYYEISVPRVADLMLLWPEFTFNTVMFRPHWSVDDELFRVAPGVLDEYHICWDNYLLFTETVFSLIEPFVDWNYFGVDTIVV